MEKLRIKTPREFQIETISDALYDYGKIHKGIPEYASYSPQSLDDAIRFMKYTSSIQMDLRFRGSGHTFNGVTLPVENEVLVFTEGLDQYRFEEDGSLSAGAGAVLWDVSDLAGEYGFDIMVYNGGWAGPTVGGFINAGGFGKGNLSRFNGGLWESLNSITLIDAFGNTHVIDRNHEMFPWMFGSYGQLGFIVEANFKLKKRNTGLFSGSGNRTAFPFGKKGRVPKRQKDDPRENMLAPTGEKTDILFWYSLLISPNAEDQAWRELQQWVEQYPDIIKPFGGWRGPRKNQEHIGYHYFIKYIDFHPPLIYEKQEDFLMIGVMSWVNMSESENIQKVFRAEQAFLDIAEKNNYRVYVQTQNFEKKLDFSQYYGPEICDQFLQYKNRLDPTHRINRNVFFDS